MCTHTIQERIRARRKELRIKLQELANTVGVATSTIARWENPKMNRTPKATELLTLAKALNTTPEFLLNGHDEKLSETKREIIPSKKEKNEIMATISLGDDKKISVPANTEGYAFLERALIIAMGKNDPSLILPSEKNSEFSLYEAINLDEGQN